MLAHSFGPYAAVLVLLAIAIPAAADTFDIPRLDNVIIDGSADDWPDTAFRVDAGDKP